MPDPLTPEEVTALEHSSEGCTHENFYRALRTIRDRERELAELQAPPDEECWLQLITYAQKCGDGPLLINRITAEYIKMRRERDELQRKLEECERRLNG